MRIIVSLFILALMACHSAPHYNVLINNALIYDGSGDKSYIGSIGIIADTIAYVGLSKDATADEIIDAEGLSVSPGFINMLSWSTESLIQDGRSLGELKQGVTLEVMGEGWSMGPWNEAMKAETKGFQKDIVYDIDWTSLGEYLQYLEEKGVSVNVASFVGATTLRIHELGEANRAPSPEELERMKALAKQAMEEGAMGIGSSLIYAPAFYAKTDELIELCKVASQYGGMYISHLRSEGDNWLEAIDELITIADRAQIAAEIYHLKAGGKDNWYKLDLALAKIDSARSAGLKITTDMYNYTAGATGLDASMPPWVQEGGYGEWARRLKDPAIKKRVIKEMKEKGDGWENLYFAAGTPENLLLVGFRNEELRKYTGKTLTEVAQMRGSSPEETAIELVIEDSSRVGTVYFLMSEENIRRQLKVPYMSFGSDAASMATEPPFTNNNTHPRAYGNFARLLGKYVRDEKIIPMEEAIFKLTKLPATNLKIKKRGQLVPGYYADIVIFDPSVINDLATFDTPHQYSVGVKHVWVNGVKVLNNGEHTGQFPGKVVRGPGWKEPSDN
jgi:N-acyl-D-amino-acid deacylase